MGACAPRKACMRHFGHLVVSRIAVPYQFELLKEYQK